MENDYWSYIEITEDITEDYNKFITGEKKLSYRDATARIFYEYEHALDESETERIMIFTAMAVFGMKHGDINPDLKRHLGNIIQNNRLEHLKDSFDSEDYAMLRKDIETIKE
ncbi:MAG: hypothetical protein GY754_08905, partial [bacterium]|nr:hypothetical protein [bacterium]